MSRAIRIFMFVLLAGMWTTGLFATTNEARAQSTGSFLGHIVEPGETLDSIAARYHSTPSALVQENQLSVPVQLIPGQLLRIRTWGSEPVAADPTGAQPVVPEAYPGGVPLWEQDLEGERWIDINLTEQTLTAHVGDVAIRTFVVSTGGTGHETVTGSFRIWAKVSRQDMSGGSRAAGTYYYVPNVPWVQYFYADYSIHGADWHNDFGWPVSHGCVNMRVEEARWLFEWGEPTIDATMVERGTWNFPARGGTRVEVHY